jgi:hypothetical protein
MHGNTVMIDGHCSGRPKTAAAERLGPACTEERISGGAERRPLHPQASKAEATRFRAAKSSRPQQSSWCEHPNVH